MTKNLTRRQSNLLAYIEDFITGHGYGPSVRDICQGLQLSSPSTVHVHLKSLEEKGYIARESGKSRSIRLLHNTQEDSHGCTSFGTANQNLIKLPLLGDVAAGSPLFAEELIEESYLLPTSIVTDKADFLLRVKGDSMIEVGINPGDLLAIHKQDVARNGDIVVALIEDSATVKTYYREANHIRLQPENSSLEPIIVKDNVRLVGKVVALIRQFN